MAIHIHNFSSGDTVAYSLPLLVGEVHPPMSQGSISVNSPAQAQPHAWPVYNGNFKALVELQPGSNVIVLKYYEEVLEFTLCYVRPASVRFVRPIYIKCCDHDGFFQGPENEDCSPASAQKRISFAAKLLQSFTAEKMYEHQLGHVTYQLESDMDATRPACHLHNSKLTLKEAHSMCGGDLWLYFARELMASKLYKEKENCKWYAFMSFTRYEPPNGVIPRSHSDIMKYTKGHAALGGGGLALFGTGNLHTWAESLDDVITRFTDTRRIDRSKFMDDSAYREYYWANYSTGLGASLHELGHTFDLAHTPTGVMARGFDDLYRVFIVQPLPSRASSRMNSPVPYSPNKSPVHRNARDSSRSGSPKPCPLSRPHPRSCPMVIQIETCFKRLHLDSKQTFNIKNYDGSETTKTITRSSDGMELVSEVTVHLNRDKVVRETVRHLNSGKTRTTMSMSSSGEFSTSDTFTSTQCLASQAKPSQLPRSPDDGSIPLAFHERKYKDAGAHWYRSSAVLLRYHKWFNPDQSRDPAKLPILQGNIIQAKYGLRLVELRSLPDGVVFHHWEFLHDKPPSQFKLKKTEIQELASSATDLTVLAEDNQGNILKKKLNLAQLQDVEADQDS